MQNLVNKVRAMGGGGGPGGADGLLGVSSPPPSFSAPGPFAVLREKLARAKPRPSLVNRTKPLFTGVHRFGVERFSLFLSDPFHTLLNLSWWKFIAVFFSVYMSAFCVFALIYWAMPKECMIGVDGSFAHALWISSRTASTLGFTSNYPNPDCPGPNLVVMVQVICSSLVDMCMLGVVFARFSAPVKRAQSIRFSKVATVGRHSSGNWAITFRVANVRKHQLLKPEMMMIVTAIDSITPSNYVFEHLAIEDGTTQQTNLQLGFPANVVHVVRPDSPLYNLSLEEMETRMMEVLLFVDGIDAMTSKQLQARKAYTPSAMLLSEQFADMHLEMRGGKLGLDFTHFDNTVTDAGGVVDDYATSPQLRGMPMAEVQHYMQHMRHYTFRRLTEQRPGGAGAGAGAAKSGAGAAAGGGGAANNGGPGLGLGLGPAPAPASPQPGGAAAAAAAGGIELTPAAGGGGQSPPAAAAAAAAQQPQQQRQQQQQQQQQRQQLVNPFATDPAAGGFRTLDL
ncbi:hypothetical protein Rsub_04558 [Raphidocelis subcapitata]|uniref:Uncharacterized protein n=1 Tax=Raphidocelis subcapitata TaxID=307507 RepID=A0A2V0NXV1_9CHLO|nr:hypothetical protein Rsub_04558 [Raphidocelis subcapitata]|eukprot:GBF92454.1 hypothetical protein Rsub_04558 [Raphidocelis subcapitata]